jgi:hypothetical protein
MVAWRGVAICYCDKARVWWLQCRDGYAGKLAALTVIEVLGY